jgi:drug/metabolite transporter (DMT)-like permease
MWLFVSVIAYFINAGVYIADKFLLSKKIHSSITYAFYVGIWSVFNFFLLIFDFYVPSFRELGIDILAGILFLATLVFWYKALHQSEATRVVPIVGVLVPIFSLIFSFVFLGTSFGEREILSFTILIIGGFLLSVKRTKLYIFKEALERVRQVMDDILGTVHAKYRPTRRLLINSFVSALFFAVYYVLIKYVYETQPFIGGFVWSRFGTFIGVILILFVPHWRKKIKEYKKDAEKPKNFTFFIFIRLLAGLAFLMLNWAISLGEVAMVNALQGVQYLFLLLLVLFLSKKYPKVLKEELGRGVFIQKVAGVLLVSLGLYILIA